MEIHRVGSFTDARLDSTPSAESEPAAKGARRGEAELKPDVPAASTGDEPAAQPVESRPAESRQNAESMKARLFARCDQASAHDAAQSTAADGGSPLAADLSDYLRRHPGAEDSLEGIDHWKEFEGMAELDARGEAVDIERIILQSEGWARDGDTSESSGSSGEAAGENGADDPDRG